MNEENEKKKEYLGRYRKAVREMERSDLKIQELRLSRMFPSVIYDGMPHAHGYSDLSDYAVILERAEQECIRYRYMRINLCQIIIGKIDKMENEEEKDVLMYRYIKLMKWENICTKMDVSWRQVHYIHRRALEHFNIFA